MIALARTLAIVLVWLSWSLSLYCLWLIPSTTVHAVDSYDSSPSCIFVHTTDALTGQSRFNAVPSNFSSALQENILEIQAFGYIPAPTGSIVVHLKSHSAYYLPPDPTFMLEYNSSLVFVTNEYVSCEQYLDFDSHLMLHCSLSDVDVTQFSDLMLNAVLRFVFNNSARRLVLMITDMTFRTIMLCCEVSTTPTPIMLVRSIYLSCVRPLMRKHDYAVLKNFGSYSVHASRAIPIICKAICVSLRHCWMLLHRENDNQLYVPQKCVGVNTDIPSAAKKQVGGGSKRTSFFQNQELIPYRFDKSTNIASAPKQKYVFEAYMIEAHANARYAHQKDVLLCTCTLSFLAPRLTGIQLRSVARHHNIFIGTNRAVSEAVSTVIQHQCNNCNKYISVFRQNKPIQKNKSKYTINFRQQLTEAEKVVAKKQNTRNRKKARDIEKTKFPPSSPTKVLMQKIVRGFCKSTSPNKFEESGCAVCGRLTLVSKLKSMEDVDCDFSILNRKGSGVNRKERTSVEDLIEEIPGPVLDNTCSHVCNYCVTSLSKGHTPHLALANDMWIGTVPVQLQGLTYAEKLLVARVRHNRCVVRVTGGMHKMKANAITFANPTPKVYRVLPPPIEELDEVLAFIYTGPCRPTEEDFKRTPLLVRRNKVACALEWLKLNHIGYKDLGISYENLNKYPEDGPPVVVDYRKSNGERDPEATAAYENEREDGTSTGECPFVVHGLTGEELVTKSLRTLIAIAVDHMDKNKKVLAIGHEQEPQSIYHNPLLYPKMFPWLFPYGLGGIGSVTHKGKISSLTHKGHLLMYHDKRFQKDPHFPLIAFNHEQIKEGTTGGYLLTEKQSFPIIADRLLNLDSEVLTDIAKRMTDGERVKPQTPEEKACFQVIHDLDHVGRHVQGSITNKKYMRNEIWSLISFMGAPSWFITFSPADNRHPICLYFADTSERFSPVIRAPDECYRLIASNPVAGARFFHFMVQNFIQHVLGVGERHPGIYGETSAYYGTVEQQGRLTLHLHLLLWIKGSLTPQEIRDRIMDPDSDFQKKMVEYLESVHQGEFLTGDIESVRAEIEQAEMSDSYKIPTKTLPEQPPPVCKRKKCDGCFMCLLVGVWWHKFRYTVDDLLWRSNIHVCGDNCYSNGRESCKSRFPRELFDKTVVDPETGALNMKKGEAQMNTFTPLLTYLLRCNTDVTSLLSGTAVKAVVAYVTEYVTKPGLKTYSIFDTIRSVFDRNSELIGGSQKRREKARRLLTQIVNSLTARIEVGGPMASLYLLKNPDHYTSHTFKTFYWKSYVREVKSAWPTENKNVVVDKEVDKLTEKVVIDKRDDEYVALSAVDDYIYRPSKYDDVCLYDWIRLATKFKKNRKRHTESDDEDNDKVSRHVTCEKFNDDKKKRKSIRVKHMTQKLKNHLEYEEREDDAYVRGSSWADSEDDDESPINDESEDGLFASDHPQNDTHHVRLTVDNDTIVPNFVGGSLPRCDKGDREFYCCTMLTLFKPWRSGKDLKTSTGTWDDSFHLHDFSKRQHEIIKYFNVRYECLDARDDYSANRNKLHNSTIFPQWTTNEVLDNLDDDQLHTGEDFETNEQADEEYDRIGAEGQKVIEQMMEMENIIKNSGWLEDCVDGPPSVDVNAINPDLLQGANKWDAAVQSKRQEFLDEKSRHMPTHPTLRKKTNLHDYSDEVKIIDKTYLEKTHDHHNLDCKIFIDDTVHQYKLNIDQERAFRIIANHATSSQSERLSMYLGGMGGTGKSQVIKALMHFFLLRNEEHRFLILAPTGSAAALLNGSTYHSALAINDRTNANTVKNLAQVRNRIEGVDYIFLDEVSMLSCHDMFKISAQLAKATHEVEEPFGGMNMIFAGDFAQLQPVTGAALYSTNVGTKLASRMSVKKQEETIGKALWHQITTVVILRENMRQKTQTPEDTRLRSALENMRYKSCTIDDVNFLRTRISGTEANRPVLAQKKFRNVSIITAWNAHKDQINKLGSLRFARETNQNLTTFYSKDQWAEDDDSNRSRRKINNYKRKPIRKSNTLNPGLQKALWSLPHGSTEHIPGKLSICVGMPVMLRHNEATECCMTKGTEATVAGWQASIGPHEKPILDTLFVKLSNPPKVIQIAGLPQNVVPITRRSTKTVCKLWNDDVITINRNQVPILPNFAMTDYSAQGRTRPENVVELNNCKNHQSYYTCLSRSATAEGTIILQGFDSSKIMGGASGYLRQEFRELEILDFITKMRYEGHLPRNVDGHRRNTIIQQFLEWKGADYVPDQIHPAIKWSKSVPFKLQEAEHIVWHIPRDSKNGVVNSGKKDSSKYVAAKGSVPIYQIHNDVHQNKKHKLDEQHMDSNKKQKTKHTVDETSNCFTSIGYEFDKAHKQLSTENDNILPVGLIWDGLNYSCAYDAFFTILRQIWLEDPMRWTQRFSTASPILHDLANGFQLISSHNITFEHVRNDVRQSLHNNFGNMFPYGSRGTSVIDLAGKVLNNGQINASSQLECTNCQFIGGVVDDRLSSLIFNSSNGIMSTKDQLRRTLVRLSRLFCPECLSQLQEVTLYHRIPKMLMFSVVGQNISASKIIKLEMENRSREFYIKGIVYHGGFHFTSRVITNDGRVWFHDGQLGANCQYEKKLSEFTEMELNTCNERQMSLVIYAQN